MKTMYEIIYNNTLSEQVNKRNRDNAIGESSLP
jgi:hypothetical protein